MLTFFSLTHLYYTTIATSCCTVLMEGNICFVLHDTFTEVRFRHSALQITFRLLLVRWNIIPITVLYWINISFGPIGSQGFTLSGLYFIELFSFAYGFHAMWKKVENDRCRPVKWWYILAILHISRVVTPFANVM